MEARLILLFLFISLCSAGYNLKYNWGGADIIEKWKYYNGADPTHGYVYYTTYDQAHQWGYVSAQNGKAFIRSDSGSISSGSGRGSVRLSSPIQFTKGLVIADIAHMPVGMGTWPAFWTCTTIGWPQGGEIDVVEGVNDETLNQMTLHASPTCTVPGKYNEFANVLGTNCDVYATGNAGCARKDVDSTTYGNGFNNIGGGVYAMQWEDSGVYIWFFPRNRIPADINSNTPNPAGWGNPRARFAFNQGCDGNAHFKNHEIIFDNTFCGDWAGAVYSGGDTACRNFVRDNPGAFANAYWAVNSVKLYQL